VSRIFDRDKTDISYAYETVIRVMNQWHEAHRAEFVSSGYTHALESFNEREEKHGHIGGKYMRLDTGTSGAFMLELATGDVYGIKGYGKIDKKKCSGNIYEPGFDGATLFKTRFQYGRFDLRKAAQ
jgi:hypothetical protein